MYIREAYNSFVDNTYKWNTLFPCSNSLTVCQALGNELYGTSCCTNYVTFLA